jgi:hypothetical protein
MGESDDGLRGRAGAEHSLRGIARQDFQRGKDDDRGDGEGGQQNCEASQGEGKHGRILSRGDGGGAIGAAPRTESTGEIA